MSNYLHIASQSERAYRRRRIALEVRKAATQAAMTSYLRYSRIATYWELDKECKENTLKQAIEFTKSVVTQVFVELKPIAGRISKLLPSRWIRPTSEIDVYWV
jgi:hypothetical protein